MKKILQLSVNEKFCILLHTQIIILKFYFFCINHILCYTDIIIK